MAAGDAVGPILGRAAVHPLHERTRRTYDRIAGEATATGRAGNRGGSSEWSLGEAAMTLTLTFNPRNEASG